jgi:hypothetical protein
MSPQGWLAVVISIISISVSFASLIRWLVKHYLSELKPNGGSSLRDAVNRLDTQVKDQSKRIDDIYSMLYIHVRKEK